MATLNLLLHLHLPPFSFCSFFISVAVVLVMKRQIILLWNIAVLFLLQIVV